MTLRNDSTLKELWDLFVNKKVGISAQYFSNDVFQSYYDLFKLIDS